MAADKKCVFLVNRDKFRCFVEAVQAKGISDVSDKEKVTTGELFENFLLEAVKGGIVVTATDTKQNRVIAQHSMKAGDGLEVKSPGKIPVTNMKDFLTCLQRVGGDKKSKNIQVEYPDEENKILFSKIGSDTGFQCSTKGEGDLTSQEKINEIKHSWNPELKVVVSKSSQKSMDIPWPHKVIVVPSALREIAKDVSCYVKQRTARMEMKGVKVVFFLGDPNSSRKGARELQPVNRKQLVFEHAAADKKGWTALAKVNWTEPKADAEDIVANYYHGFYAVLQALDDGLQTEMHFINLLGGWMCWIHAENADMELNYMIPYDK